jgi:hypothetical protein
MEIQEAAQSSLECQGTIFPATWAVDSGVGSVYGLETVEVICRPPNATAFTDEDGRLAIGASATREQSCAGGVANVDGKLRV